jgi:hypothetical protein
MAESEEIKKIKKQLEDLKKSLDDVSKRSIDRILKSFTEGGASLNEWRQQLEFFQDEADSVSDSLNYISKSLSASVSELRQGNDQLRKQVSATKKLSSIADQLLAIRKGDASLDKKKIDKLKDEAKLRLQILKSSQSQYSIGSANYLALQNDIDAATELLGAFEGIESTAEDINKKLGILPSIAGGIDKALSKIGLPPLGITDAIDETQRLGQEAARVGDKGFKPMSTFLGKVGENFSSLITKANLLQGALALTIDALFNVDKGAGEMAKSMNMTYSEALAYRKELTGIANTSMDVAVNTRGLQETYMAIGQSLGSNAKLNEKDLITATKLREQAGYTNEQLAELNKLSSVNGKSLEQNTKEILGGAKAYASRKGLVINEKQVLDDVVKSSASLKLSLGGSADALAKSAVQARAVGLNLEQAASIADSLLQFESSIENELSAELLTGKDLNFERARTLALNNDIAGAAEEIANQVGTSADFAKMNAIQQESIAKAAGLTKDQLAQSLMDREALQKLSGIEGKDAKEKFDNLVKQVGMEEAKKRLGNEQLANQFAQQSVQERFNQTVEKLKEIFVNVANALMPVFDVLAEVFNIVGPIAGVLGTIIKYTMQWGKYLLIPLGIMKGFTLAMDGIVGLQNLLNKGLSLQITKEGAINSLKTIGNTLTLGLFSLQTQQNAAAAVELATEEGKVSFKQLGLALEGESLAVKARAYAIALKDFLMEKASLVFQSTRNALEVGYNAIKKAGSAIAKSELLLNIGKAAMGAISSLSSIPIVGWALGLAAAGTVAALGYKFMKGNDIMSPGDGSSGYGSRTLFGPEGAIQLNNKDTVIAGTDLFKKGDDTMGPKGALQVSNKTAPVSPPPDSNALLIAEMKRGNDQRAEQIKLQKRDTSVSTIRVQ